MMCVAILRFVKIINEAQARRIRNLEAVIERQKETIEHQGDACEEKHNILCGVKEAIDEYFLKG